MNEKMDKKQKNLFIVAVVTMIAIVAGATYAYFSVGTTNLFGTSTINATADSMGTVIMQGTNANLTMSLSAVDMMRANDSITYYATTEGKTTDVSKKETVIARAYVSPETDTNMYHCTYNLNISHTGTKDMYYTFLGVENAVAETDLYSYRVNEYDTLEACNNFIDSDGSTGQAKCQQFGNKYSIVENDEIAANVLYTSQSECETAVANTNNEFTFTCYKRINAGDTYLKRQATPYNRSNAEIILTVNGTDYDWNSGMPSTIRGEFNIMAPQEIELTAGLRLINKSYKDQTGLAGSDISISITSDSLVCNAIDTLEDNNVTLGINNTQSSISIGNNVSGLANSNNKVILNDLTKRNDEYTLNNIAVTEQYKYYGTPNGKTTTETLVPLATITNNNAEAMNCAIYYQLVTSGNMLAKVQELDNNTLLNLSIYNGNELFETYGKDNYPNIIRIPVTIAGNSNTIIKSKLELSRNAEDSDIDSLYDTNMRLVFVPYNMLCEQKYNLAKIGDYVIDDSYGVEFDITSEGESSYINYYKGTDEININIYRETDAETGNSKIIFDISSNIEEVQQAINNSNGSIQLYKHTFEDADFDLYDRYMAFDNYPVIIPEYLTVHNIDNYTDNNKLYYSDGTEIYYDDVINLFMPEEQG